jgi:hypothetical protein
MLKIFTNEDFVMKSFLKMPGESKKCSAEVECFCLFEYECSLILGASPLTGAGKMV